MSSNSTATTGGACLSTCLRTPKQRRVVRLSLARGLLLEAGGLPLNRTGKTDYHQLKQLAAAEVERLRSLGAVGQELMTEPDATSADASSDPIDAIRGYYGARPQTSDWYTVTQEMVDQFGAATGDSEWIHCDPERARRESPYGGTIAHGFWTLSILVHLSRLNTPTDYPPGALFGINYGFNRVRFPGAVPVGSRVRLHSKLLDVAPREVADTWSPRKIRLRSMARISPRLSPSGCFCWCFPTDRQAYLRPILPTISDREIWR